VRVAGFFGAGLAREKFDERRLSIHQEIERGVDGVQIVELVEAVGPGAEFAGRLRTAEEEDAYERDLVAMEVEDIGEAVFELGDAAVGGSRTGEALLRERMESAADGLFVEFHGGLAIGFLIGGVLEGVERERVVVGSGDFFFDEAAEDAGLGGGETKGGHGENDTNAREARQIGARVTRATAGGATTTARRPGTALDCVRR